jgi:hypothetical protein
MIRSALAAAVLLCLVNAPAGAADDSHAPPAPPFRKVSELVKLPDFLPGMGTLYVDPKTLPAGPFLTYDHGGRLVSTIYMVPLKDLDAHNKFSGLGAVGQTVDHVDLYYNAGHPGMEMPHYHIVLWHVSKSDEASVAK